MSHPNSARYVPLVRRLARPGLLIPLLSIVTAVDAGAQVCPGTNVITGLRRPLGMALSNQGNLLVAESGTTTPNSGRISILDPSGSRRTLLDGLPSAINDVNEPSGPSGIAIRGRTIYALIGIGDSVLPGPVPGSNLPNPNVSSPIFSSVLAIHLSASAEQNMTGFTLSMADQEMLADGERVILSHGGGDSIEIELVANFPDTVPNPLPGFPAVVRGSNPFSLVVVAERLYVTDGGRNLVWRVEMPTGDFWPLSSFPTIPNPLFPGVGGPVIEAVPTGIAYSDGQLLVTLFRGVPFAPGTSTVVSIDPSTGQFTSFISGLKTAIEVIPFKVRSDEDFLILQHSSGGAPFFAGPGVVLHLESPGAAQMVIANCLTRPTAMVYDEAVGIIYVAELLTGRIVALNPGW
jgi:hypothetical protein